MYTPPSGMTPDPGDGTSQAAHLGNPGRPLDLLPQGHPQVNFAYCFSLTGNCSIGYEVQVNPAGLRGVLSAPLRDYRLRRQAVPVIRDDAGGVVGREYFGHRHRRVRDRPGHDLARRRPRRGSADLVHAISDKGRERQGARRGSRRVGRSRWSRGRPAEACTGSPTRSRTTFPTTRWSRWRPR